MNDAQEKVICSSCAHELEIGDYPFCPHESIYAMDAQAFEPIIVHKDAQGNVRFPGSKDSPVPAGFQKVALTTSREVRALEREVNQYENAKARENHEGQRVRSEGEHKERREAFREQVKRMSPRGQRFAEAMMQARDQHKGRLQKPFGDVNFHVDIFSNDSSNREKHYDKSTGWRGRKA